MQVQNFSKIRFKIFEKYFFKNSASISCRGCQILSSNMRIIILLLIMKKELGILCKYKIFRKFSLKFLKIIFLKISFIFL